VPEFGEDQF